MPNTAIDFAKDRYFILAVTTNGPSRVEGHMKITSLHMRQLKDTSQEDTAKIILSSLKLPTWYV